MYYPGNQVPFLLSLAAAGGEPADVVTPPYLSILNVADDVALDLAGEGVKSAPMPAIDGADALYKFLWNTAGVPDGTYVAVVSYVANGLNISNRLLATVQLGDSRVTQEVAAYASAARRTDLPDKTLVMLKSDFVAPADDDSVQAILAKVNGLPENVASQATLSQALTLLSDIHDVEFGTWVQDKSVTPNRLTLYRKNGDALQAFDLIRNDNTSSRTRR